MVSAMPKKFPKYLSCEGGSTVIEFAFVFPILLLFIFAMIQFGFLIFEQATLQGSLSSAAREGKTGYPSPSDPGNECTGGVCQFDRQGNITNLGARWVEVQGIMQSLTKNLFDPTQLTVSATSYPDFATLESAMQSGAPCGTVNGCTSNDVGSGGQVVVYTATYPAPTYLNPILGLAKGKGVITAITIERNEGF